MSLEVLLQAAQYVQEHNRLMAGQLRTTNPQHHHSSDSPPPPPTNHLHSSTPTDQRSSPPPAHQQRQSGSDRSSSSSKSVLVDVSGYSGYHVVEQEEEEESSSDSNDSAYELQNIISIPEVVKGASSSSRRGSARPTTENRSVHNVLEKNRRAHLKDCFDTLKSQVLDAEDEKKASHLAVLKSAVRCIRQLQRQTDQLQAEQDKLGKDKQSLQLRCQELKREALQRNPAFDIAGFLWRIEDEVECDSQATCTAPPGSPRPIPSLLCTTEFEFKSSSEPKSSSKKRKKHHNAVADSIDPRKAKLKSVTDILQEFRPNTPALQLNHHQNNNSNNNNNVTSTTSSPPSRSSSPRNLPIRLRILQDQQKGMFKAMPENEEDEEEKEVATSPVPLVLQQQQHNTPSMMASAAAAGGFWTDGVSIYGPAPAQMFANGLQSYVNVMMGGGGGGGGLGPMLIMPTTNNPSFPYYQQQPPPPPPPSSSSSSSSP